MKLRTLSSIPPTALLLLPWAALTGFALRTDAYGLTEEGSKAILLAWSIGDQVASAVFTLGAPDIRVIFFLPLGFLWPGQIVAAKLMTLAVMAAAGVALYSWRARDDQAEAALLASGLLLIAPLTIGGIDALSAGPYLLLIFAMADWVNRRLTRERGTMGGWFFAQLLLCGAAVSLHPAGVAYPMVLVRSWLAIPHDRRDRQVALLGIPSTVLFVLVMRLGWNGLAWAQSPLTAAAVFGGSRPPDTWSGADWFGGIALIGLTLTVAVHERRRLLADLTGGSLLLGTLFGLAAADRTWGLLLLALLLYGGFPWLLRACAPLVSRGVMLQRGWLWVLLLMLCTLFMRANQGDFEAGRRHFLSAEDGLISAFTEEVGRASDAAPTGDHAAPLLVASPWPARTSIACQCAALPLPPAAQDPDSQLAMMRGVSYVILSDTLESRALAANFSQLGSRAEVLAKQPGGVILRLLPPRAAR